jgi:hypothetical protein
MGDVERRNVEKVKKKGRKGKREKRNCSDG